MKVAVFDWDGTVIDNFDLMYNVFHRQVILGGGNPPQVQDFLRTYEPPHMKYLEKCGAVISEEDAWKVWSHFTVSTELHKGVRELLVDLKNKNIPCYIATANQTKRIKEQLEKFSLDDYFVEIYSQEHKHLTLEQICRMHVDVDRESIFYLGDMRIDMSSAANVKVTGIGIASSGHKDTHMNLLSHAGARHVFSSLNDFHLALTNGDI